MRTMRLGGGIGRVHDSTDGLSTYIVPPYWQRTAYRVTRQLIPESPDPRLSRCIVKKIGMCQIKANVHHADHNAFADICLMRWR